MIFLLVVVFCFNVLRCDVLFSFFVMFFLMNFRGAKGVGAKNRLTRTGTEKMLTCMPQAIMGFAWGSPTRGNASLNLCILHVSRTGYFLLLCFV